VARLVDPPLRATTLLLWGAFFLVMGSFYFALNWTPKILVDSGLSMVRGVSGGVLMNVGGIVGASLLGWTSSRMGLRRLVAGYMGACAAAFGLFATLGTALAPRLAVAALLGFFLFGSMVGLYAMAPRLYPPAIRTTGIGWAIGVGRSGAVLGPWVAGVLLASGWSSATCYALFALPMLAAMVAVTRMGRAEG
jgi:MFS family permease